MQAERDPWARRTWGRAAPATRHWRRERELRAFGALASHPFSGAEWHSVQPEPEAASPWRAPRLDAPARPEPSGGSASRKTLPGLLNAGITVYYSLEGW